MSTEFPSDSDVAAALEAAVDHHEPVVDVNNAYVVAHRNDRTVTHVDLEQYLDRPVRQRGTVKALTAAGFVAAVVQRSQEPDGLGPAVVYADADRCGLVAVLNDDHVLTAGWRDHRVQLALAATPEWTHWTSRQGLGSQTRFAETIEDGEYEIVEPSATTMLEIAQTFQATTGARFKQRGRLKDGATQFTYEEDIEASAGSGEPLRIPDRFTIAVRPFFGVEARQVECRIRFRVSSDGLQIGYQMHRPDDVRRNAFAEVVDTVREALAGYTVIEGTPAEPVRAGR